MQGTPIEAFAAPSPSTPPRRASSPPRSRRGTSLPAGDLTRRRLLRGDQRGEPRHLRLLLSGQFLIAPSITPTASAFDATGTVLTLQYSGLPDDAYTLDLVSGDFALEDLAGNDLDGEPLAWPIPPNCRATASRGATSSSTSSIDATAVRRCRRRWWPSGRPSSLVFETPEPATWAPSPPRRHRLVHARPRRRADAHRAVARARAAADGPGLRPPRRRLLGSAGGTAGSGADPADGRDDRRGDVHDRHRRRGRHGACTGRRHPNAAVEEEHGGPQRRDRHGAADRGQLHRRSAPAPSGRVLGQADFLSYTAEAVAFAFEDISDTGTATLQVVDDAVEDLTPADLAGFAFTFYGPTYDTVSFSSNGLITFGGANGAFTNTDLTDFPSEATIAAFWDDLVTFVGGLGGLLGGAGRRRRPAAGHPVERRRILRSLALDPSLPGGPVGGRRVDPVQLPEPDQPWEIPFPRAPAPRWGSRTPASRGRSGWCWRSTMVRTSSSAAGKSTRHRPGGGDARRLLVRAGRGRVGDGGADGAGLGRPHVRAPGRRRRDPRHRQPRGDQRRSAHPVRRRRRPGPTTSASPAPPSNTASSSRGTPTSTPRTTTRSPRPRTHQRRRGWSSATWECRIRPLRQ